MDAMSSKFRWVIVLISTPLVVLVTVGGLLGATNEIPGQRGARAAGTPMTALEDVLSLIYQAYVEEVDFDKVMDGAMRGLTDGLDRSSAFLRPEEVRAIEANAAQPAGDVGLTIVRQFYLRVVGVRDGSPAARAGLQTNDFIRAIDGTPTRDMSGISGARLLRGAPGSKVTLVVIRGNAADPHEFVLTREAPSVKPVSVNMLPDGVAQIRIATFGANTAALLGDAIAAAAKQGAKSAVIDLRGTADGSPEDGIAAARLFVKSGTLAVRAGREETDRLLVSAQPGDGAITMPVGLLVSNGTANAAEIFAAALSGNDRAELIGQPTGGIAGVQKLVRLPENYGLWLTHQRYMQIDGKDPIHDRGLRPTVGVDIPTIGFDEVAPNTDEPLAKAAERMRSKYMLTTPGKLGAGSRPLA
jgi:carboxyl-terminal processing protease